MFGLQPEPDQGLTDEEATMLEAISDAVHEELQRSGGDEIKADITNDVLDAVTAVADAMISQERTQLSESDFALIRQRVGKISRKHQAPAGPQKRFGLLDRVVCKIGGERGWAAGAVQALDEDDPTDPTGQSVLPYVVKIDPPNSRLVSVPKDSNGVVRAEVCFGQAWFTRMCLPRAVRKGAQRVRRFGMNDRVACAVEDATGNYSDWAAGTVTGLDHALEAEDGVAGGLVPYQVLLDSGRSVLVHQDEHWLVRDLALQAPGPRIAADGAPARQQRGPSATRQAVPIGPVPSGRCPSVRAGTRCLKRMEKRTAGDQIEMVDHVTRKVRKTAPDSDDSDDE